MPSENLFRKDQVFFTRSREIKDANTTSRVSLNSLETENESTSKRLHLNQPKVLWGNPVGQIPKQGRCPNGSLYRVFS